MQSPHDPHPIILPHPMEPEVRPEPLPDWLKYVLSLLLAAMVAYFTSQAKTDSAMARIEEREENHYKELKASIDLLREDIRDLRAVQRP